MSAQNVSIKGITPGDENHRISLNMSSQKDFGKLKASFTARYTQGKYDINAGGSFGNGRDYIPYWNLINTPIQIPITEFRDWRNDKFSNPNYYFNDYYYNPYWTVDNFRQVGRSDDILGNVQLDYKMTNWLSFTYRLGATVSSASSKATQGAFVYNAFVKASGKSNAVDLNAAVQDQSLTQNRINSELFGTAQKDFGKFNFKLLLGHSFRETNSKSLAASSNNLGIPEVFNLSVRKGEPTVGEGSSQARLQRFFGSFGIGFNKWLFGEVTGSYDTDSRLYNPYNDDSKISFFYPGASLSIVLTDAIPFLKDNRKTFSAFLTYLFQ